MKWNWKVCRVKGSNYSNFIILLLGIIKGINKGIKRRELEFSFYVLLRREEKEEKPRRRKFEESSRGKG